VHLRVSPRPLLAVAARPLPARPHATPAHPSCSSTPQSTKTTNKQQGNNAFLRSSVNGTVLSADPLNLTARHSYSASGIANDRAVGIAAAPGGGVAVTTKRPRSASKPVSALSTAASKKSARRQLRGLAKLASGYRPDLKKAALAKLSAVAKAQRVAAAAAKAT
jgi:large subunit ribosomal protein L28e